MAGGLRQDDLCGFLQPRTFHDSVILILPAHKRLSVGLMHEAHMEISCL